MPKRLVHARISAHRKFSCALITFSRKWTSTFIEYSFASIMIKYWFPSTLMHIQKAKLNKMPKNLETLREQQRITISKLYRLFQCLCEANGNLSHTSFAWCVILVWFFFRFLVLCGRKIHKCKPANQYQWQNMHHKVWLTNDLIDSRLFSIRQIREEITKNTKMMVYTTRRIRHESRMGCCQFKLNCMSVWCNQFLIFFFLVFRHVVCIVQCQHNDTNNEIQTYTYAYPPLYIYLRLKPCINMCLLCHG